MNPLIFLTLVKIIIQLIHLGIYPAGNFTGNTKKSSLVKFVKLKKHPKRKHLQHYKCQEGKITPDEKEDVTHEQLWAISCELRVAESLFPKPAAHSSKLFIASQKDNGHNFLKPILCHEPRSSADRQQHEQAILFFGLTFCQGLLTKLHHL